MTYQELKERCKNRVFDRIEVVVKDIFQTMVAVQHIMNVVPGDIRICTNETNPGLETDAGEIAYMQRQASFFYENTELCLIQPVEGETVYKKYLDRFGESICCVRERVSTEQFEKMSKKFVDNKRKTAQRMESETCRAAWLDLTDELGILYQMITEDSEKTVPSYVIPKRIAQINITTPDVRKTIETIADVLEIGPWEVGRQNNRTVHDSGFRVDGKLQDVEFDFLLAILPCGNLEWEAIEPVKGPLVYNDFLKRRGIGYHHILQEVPQAEWEEVQKAYGAKGIEMACKGSVGPIDWCYMDTEEQLHFYSELRTDAVMDRLPDGYLQYFYPEEN